MGCPDGAREKEGSWRQRAIDSTREGHLIPKIHLVTMLRASAAHVTAFFKKKRFPLLGNLHLTKVYYVPAGHEQ